MKAKAEFKRILKPGGNVVLMWNDRRTTSSDFLKAYEDLLAAQAERRRSEEES